MAAAVLLLEPPLLLELPALEVLALLLDSEPLLDVLDEPPALTVLELPERESVR